MGHAYEAVAADVIARYHRVYGREVFFLTGADEHGQKIADTAAGQGLTPIQLCDKHVEQFQKLDHTLRVEFDGYAPNPTPCQIDELGVLTFSVSRV